jgi:sugar phosphate isomerase/epimerase
MYTSWNARAVGLALTAEEAIEVAVAAEFSGVDLLVCDLVEAGTSPRKLRRRMDDTGIRGGAWPLPVRWRGDADEFAADLEALPRLAEVASILGLTRTGTWVMPDVDPSALEPGTEAPDARQLIAELHLERLGKIARVLGEHGSKLGLEILGPAGDRHWGHDPFVRKYAELEGVLGELRRSHANVGVLIDAFHLFAAGEPDSAGWVWGEEAVVWVHLADAAHDDLARLRDRERALPGGTGLGDSRTLLMQLQRCGYDGPVTVEPLGLSIE